MPTTQKLEDDVCCIRIAVRIQPGPATLSAKRVATQGMSCWWPGKRIYRLGCARSRVSLLSTMMRKRPCRSFFWSCNKCRSKDILGLLVFGTCYYMRNCDISVMLSDINCIWYKVGVTWRKRCDLLLEAHWDGRSRQSDHLSIVTWTLSSLLTSLDSSNFHWKIGWWSKSRRTKVPKRVWM